MSSFLPENCYVVCTKQMGSGHRQLVRAGGQRAEFTVIFRAGQRPWLTKEDKKLNEDFECKTQWSSPVAFGAFGAGVATGLAVGVALGWIPVVGQIILGVIAVAAIGYALYSFFSNKVKCSERLASPASRWIVFHQTVTFNNFNAVNKRSILQCQEGGSLLPFISESLAAQAAQAIAFNNRMDIGINALATYVSGMFFAFAAIPAGGAGASLALTSRALLGASGQFAFGMFVGKYVINPLTEIEGEMLRDNIYDDTGEIYDDMNQDAARDGRNGLANFIPDFEKSQLDGVDPSTEWNPGDVTQVVRDLRMLREIAIKNGASRQSIEQLNEAIRSAENNRSLSPKKNPAMRQVVENIKNGTYGKDVQRMFTNRSGNMRGMNRRANYERAINRKNEAINRRRTPQRNAQGRTVGNLIQIFQPFISTFFSERARAAAARYAEQDLANDAGFVAAQN